MASCRSCGAPIEWGEWSKSGKAVPLDLEPTENGNLVLITGKVRHYTRDDERLARPRRTSHFASCPDAKQWRRWEDD